MTAQLYPQFANTIRIDGRLTSVESYLGDRCGQRVGPAAAACLAEGGKEARLLLRREQAKSVLFIVGPIFFFLFAVPPVRFVRERYEAARTRPRASAADR